VPGIENVSSLPFFYHFEQVTLHCLVLMLDFMALQVDASDVIEGHSSYLWSTPQILDQLDLDAYFPVFKSSSAQS